MTEALELVNVIIEGLLVAFVLKKDLLHYLLNDFILLRDIILSFNVLILLTKYLL